MPPHCEHAETYVALSTSQPQHSTSPGSTDVPEVERFLADTFQITKHIPKVPVPSCDPFAAETHPQLSTSRQLIRPLLPHRPKRHHEST